MKIIFTGGGTAGHAMVNTVLIPYLQAKECKTVYIGSKNGMEKKMIEKLPDVPYYAISTGKFRRYSSLKNLTDIFRIARGVFDALKIIKQEKPQLIYSSGGYVSVPVVWAAYILKVPVIIRETDYSPGLANRLCMPFAQKVFVTFPDTAEKIKKSCFVDEGMIIRPQLFDEPQFSTTFINMKKPICLVVGGSSGATNINNVIWDNIAILSQKYSIIHICGKGKYNAEIADTDSYQQMEYVEDIGVFYHIADVVITRSGSNAIIEGLLLGKRMICVPLSSNVSRGEQLLNAQFAEKNGTAVIMNDEQFNIENLMQALHTVLTKEVQPLYRITKAKLIKRIEKHSDTIYNLAFKQFKQDIYAYIKYGTKLNLKDLSAWEIDIFDEYVANYDM